MPTTLTPTPWNPTKLIRVEDGPFDTSMGTAKVKTDATFGYLKALGSWQGSQALACEYVGSSLARWFGLPVAAFAVMTLTEADCYDLPRGMRTLPGPAFVSRELAGRTWGGVADDLRRLANPEAVTRLVVFDTWIRNHDRHPPDPTTWTPNPANVFLADTARPGRPMLHAIDHTHCFNRRELSPYLAAVERVQDAGTYGLFPAFRDFIEPADLAWSGAQLRTLRADEVRAIVDGIPAEWEVGGPIQAALVELIVNRAAWMADRIRDGWGTNFREPIGGLS